MTTNKEAALDALQKARATVTAMPDDLDQQTLLLQICHAWACVTKIEELRRPRRAAKKAITTAAGDFGKVPV